MQSYIRIAFFIFLLSLVMSMLSNLGYMNIMYQPNQGWIQQVQSVNSTSISGTASMTPMGWVGGIMAAFNLVTSIIWQSTFGLYTMLRQLGVPDVIAMPFYLVNLFSFLILLIEFLRGMRL